MRSDGHVRSPNELFTVSSVYQPAELSMAPSSNIVTAKRLVFPPSQASTLAASFKLSVGELDGRRCRARSPEDLRPTSQVCAAPRFGRLESMDSRCRR